MANIETRLIPFPGCDNCKVHRGFYTALLDDFDAVTNEIKRLLTQYPNAKVKTTGHSLGAALAQLAAMELLHRGIKVDNVYNFGQPRTGNSFFSAYSSSSIPQFRHVHYKDPVPHVPPPAFGFVHTCNEMYEPNEIFDGTLNQCGNINNCEGDGSKDTCMLVWKDWQLKSDDHMTYLGKKIVCA
jgi:hypothetical protein